jgi:hypothetical protein
MANKQANQAGIALRPSAPVLRGFGEVQASPSAWHRSVPRRGSAVFGLAEEQASLSAWK